MQGKQRTVYFYEPVVKSANGAVLPIATGFWDLLHAHTKTLAPVDREYSHYGRPVSGAARSHTSPPIDYFYLDRERPMQDWPNAKNQAGALDTLASHGSVQSLHEPAYLVPVSGSNFIAITRSSGGPVTSAIESWLSLVAGYWPTGDSLELRAVTRGDSLQRLAAAKLASKVQVRMDKGALTNQHFQGQLGRALEEAERIDSGSVSVDMTISFGNVTPTDAGGGALVDDIRELLKANAPLKKVVANTMVENANGDLIRDTIDFTRDRITLTQEFGSNPNQDPTPQVVLEGMLTAIGTFKGII